MRANLDGRVGMGGFNALIGLLFCGLAGLALGAQATAAAEASTGNETFQLREVSAFEYGERDFLRGQTTLCEDKPSPKVKAYPALASENPVYGSIQFAGGEKQAKSAIVAYFAVDESQGTGKDYDRLYFDANLDLDLRNDLVVQPHRRPPENARVNWGGIKTQVVFDCVEVNFDFGPAGTRPVELMPIFIISVYEQRESKHLTFVRTRLYTGDIEIGGKPYEARLGNSYVVCGRLDSPATVLMLSPKDHPGGRNEWWGGDRLTAAHKVKGRFYTFSASPTGDQLTVHPYRGDLGTFEIGPGGRELDEMTVRGSLEAQERGVAVGGEIVDSSRKATRSCQLPVGDYRPNYITVQFGRLRIGASYNYHSDGKPRSRGDRAAVYGITIRKDKPFVLDFSNKPDVMFASPARDQRVKLGDSLEVKAVLVDPKLDMMIRDLDDTSRKQSKGPDGKPLPYERNLSLDPQVIITRANGEKVAEGVMPFG
jgi:hypothetical protein